MKKIISITILTFTVVIVALLYSGCKKIEMTNNESFETNIVQETQVVDNSVFDYSILKYKSKNSFLKGLDNFDYNISFTSPFKTGDF